MSERFAKGTNLARRCGVGALFLGLVLLAQSLVAAPRVELELCTAPGVAPTAAQEWLRALQGLDLDGIKIRGANGNERAEVETLGSGASVRYRVTGIILGRDDLRLPGGKFSPGDKAKLAKWIEKLKDGGAESLTAKVAAFGLTGKQLVELHGGLAVPVAFSTKGKSAEECVRKIVASIDFPVTVVPDVRDRFADELVADELQGVTAGSALAAVVRPLGLVVAPKVQGGRTRLEVVDSRAVKESWPVGWPSEANTGEAAPELLKFLDVEINDTPLSEAITAIQSRLKLPMLVDHNGLARHNVDLDKIKVNIRGGRTFYSKILSQALNQAKLKYEIRADEAERPFLWISSKLD